MTARSHTRSAKKKRAKKRKLAWRAARRKGMATPWESWIRGNGAARY